MKLSCKNLENFKRSSENDFFFKIWVGNRSGPLLENGLDRPKNRYGRYGFPSFYSNSISTVGVDGVRASR